MSPYRPPIRKAVVRVHKPRSRFDKWPEIPPPEEDQPPISGDPAECWSVPRVAELLDVSKKRVYQIIRERRLKVVRFGPRQIRVLKRSIEAYIGRLLVEEEERDY